MAFQLHALDPAPFAPLFALSDDELQTRGACRVVADESPGYPCRVSLADALVGETVLLTHFEHQPANTPYRASHAIFVREGIARTVPEVDEIPDALASRLLSLRAFDARDFLVAADVVDGDALAPALDTLLDDPRVGYVHLHHARQGCYAARATRP